MAHTMMITAARMKAHDEPTACEVVCANLRKSSLIQYSPVSKKVYRLTRIAFRKHYALWRLVEFSQQFLDEPSLHAPGFFWMDQVPNDCIQPGVWVDAEEHRGIFAYLQLVDGCLGKNLAEHAYLLHHVLTNLLGSDALHRLGNKFQVAVVGNTELDLVPNVREERPRVVVDGRTQYFRIRKLDYPARWMIR